MNTQVLILTSIYDFSTDLVCLLLKEKDTPFLRLNKESFSDYRITLNPVEQILLVEVNKQKYEISSSLKSIWFRQPVFLRNTPHTPLSVEQQLSRSQWSAFLRSLSVFRNAAWMNWPQSTYLAESKPYQLMIAKECGFKIPSTLVSNDAENLKFEFPNNAIIKSLDTILLRENNDCLFTYSTLISSSILDDTSTLTAPLMMQEYIDNKIDYRVTIIGNTVVTVKILSGGVGIQEDWRMTPKQNLSYETCRLPESVELSCLALMKEMNLSFGAIDLLENHEGFYFIEINPTGEWGWLCDTDRNIDQIIASWLLNS
ncbi:MAG: RimK-like protein [Methylotenera sp.]|nr:RimK-like protein [Methylotenera sp.]